MPAGDSDFVSTVIAVAVALILVGGVVAIIVALVRVQQYRLVRGASAALAHLDRLNQQFHALLAPHPPIRLTFGTSVNSKSRFDGFDLHTFINTNVLDRESWLTHQIETRVATTVHYKDYQHDFDAIAYGALGTSDHPRLSRERFTAIEQKLFHQSKLLYPAPVARVTAEVRYTSPKGQNSYSNRLEWEFDQLRQGLQAAQRTRARQCTAEASRQRERALMTPGLRMTILRRDGFRCRMCGASANDGASLQVDHIRPVSLGGLTKPENLQALCQPCNIGKSNNFVG